MGNLFNKKVVRIVKKTTSVSSSQPTEKGSTTIADKTSNK